MRGSQILIVGHWLVLFRICSEHTYNSFPGNMRSCLAIDIVQLLPLPKNKKTNAVGLRVILENKSAYIHTCLCTCIGVTATACGYVFVLFVVSGFEVLSPATVHVHLLSQ